MITSEQLRQASVRAMIALNEKEFPILLHALQQMEPISDLLAPAVEFTDAPATSYVATFPDELRPDLPAPFPAHLTILDKASDAQTCYFTVQRRVPPEEGCP